MTELLLAILVLYVIASPVGLMVNYWVVDDFVIDTNKMYSKWKKRLIVVAMFIPFLAAGVVGFINLIEMAERMIRYE